MIRSVCVFLIAVVAAWPAWSKTDIQTLTSEGGQDVWLVSEPAIPIVSVVLSFEGGANLDADGKEGAANLMMALIEEGSGELDSVAYATALEGLASSISYRAGRDSVWITVKSLKENLPQTLDLLHVALTDPWFADDAVERVRQQVLSGLRSETTSPRDMARAAFFEAAFKDHPYAQSVDGSIETVTALTQDDLFAAHQDQIDAGRVTISAVGDIDAETLLPMVDALLDGLPNTPATEVPFVEPEFEGTMDVIALDVPQSVTIFGQRALRRDDPDFYPLYVLNHILGGGGFASRLTSEVREKRGLTYGITTFIVNYDHADILMGSVASSNDRIKQAIDVTKDIWADIAQNGVTQEELDAAISYLTGAYALRFDSNSKIANILIGLQEQNLGPDFINTRNDLVRAVTLDDIRRVADRVLDADGLYFTVVGQPEGLEAD